MPAAPTFAEERSLWRQGLSLVAGVDEVGRGPLAGPVAAGAVILRPRSSFPWLSHVRDSKQLTAPARQQLADCIRRDALAWAVAFVSQHTIDRIGIAPASRLAMLQAIARLHQRPQYLLIDAFPLPTSSLPYKPIVHGDASSLSIACASIVAKVARDHLMRQHDRRYAGYGFARNKGYATPQHLAALHHLGPCHLHRRSFAPVARSLLLKLAISESSPPTHSAAV